MNKCRYCDKDAIVQQTIPGVDPAIQEHVCITHAYNADERMKELERQVMRQYGFQDALVADIIHAKNTYGNAIIDPRKGLLPPTTAVYPKDVVDRLVDVKKDPLALDPNLQTEDGRRYVKPVDVTLGTPTAGKAPPGYDKWNKGGMVDGSPIPADEAPPEYVTGKKTGKHIVFRNGKFVNVDATTPYDKVTEAFDKLSKAAQKTGEFILTATKKVAVEPLTDEELGQAEFFEQQIEISLDRLYKEDPKRIDYFIPCKPVPTERVLEYLKKRFTGWDMFTVVDGEGETKNGLVFIPR